MRRVDDGLRVRHVVEGRDAAAQDADAFVDHLDDGGETVRRARGRGQRRRAFRVVAIVVDSDDDVERILPSPAPQRSPSRTPCRKYGSSAPACGTGRCTRARSPRPARPRARPRARRAGCSRWTPRRSRARRPRRARRAPSARGRNRRSGVRRGARRRRRLVDMREVELRPAPGSSQRETPHAAEAVDADRCAGSAPVSGSAHHRAEHSDYIDICQLNRRLSL